MKKILFLLPFLILTGCNSSGKGNEIKIGLYDDLKLCSGETCETHHENYVSAKYIGKVVYNSVSLVEKEDSFVIYYDILKIERNSKTGILYYSSPSKQEREDLEKQYPSVLVEEKTFSKSGYYYSYIKVKEYAIEVPTESEEEIAEDDFWTETDKLVDEAYELYETYLETKDLPAVTKAVQFRNLYQKINPDFTYFEKIVNSRYAPTPTNSGWTGVTPASYRDGLYQLYVNYTMPILDTFNNTVTERNSGWTEEIAVSLLESNSSGQSEYFIQVQTIRNLQAQAKLSCDMI